MSRRALALSAVLFAGLSVPALVVAGGTDLGSVGGFKYRGDFAATGGPSETAIGSATCPSGQHVVGGGASLPWNGFLAHINSMYPEDGNDGDKQPDDALALRAWRGVATGSGPQASDVFAICRSDDVTYRKASERVKAGKAALVKVRCPGRTDVSGGGVRVSGQAKQAFLNSSHPFDGADSDASADDCWNVRIHNLTGGKKKVTAHAICLDRGLEHWHGGTTMNAASTRDMEIQCGDGHLASTGVEISGPASDARPSSIYPRDSEVFNTDADDIPDDETGTSSANLEGGQKVVSTWAICTK